MPQQPFYRKDISILFVPFITCALPAFALTSIYQLAIDNSWSFELIDAFTGIPTMGGAVISFLCVIYWRKRVAGVQNTSPAFTALCWAGLFLSVIATILFVGLFIYVRTL